VRRYLDRVLPEGGETPRAVRISQTGEMWQKPGARSMRFTAVEELAVEHVGFTWQARFRLVPLVTMRVVDQFAAGEGSLRVSLFGLPVQRSSGEDMTLGQALRYLAELPWAPHAMAVNQELRWREVGDGSVEVAAQVGGRRAAVRLDFDSDGDVVSTSAEARPAGSFGVRPWAGTFDDYALLGGVRVPTRAEVSWELDDGPFVYWRGALTSLELL
jgi:hypothetical protein